MSDDIAGTLPVLSRARPPKAAFESRNKRLTVFQSPEIATESEKTPWNERRMASVPTSVGANEFGLFIPHAVPTLLLGV